MKIRLLILWILLLTGVLSCEKIPEDSNIVNNPVVNYNRKGLFVENGETFFFVDEFSYSFVSPKEMFLNVPDESIGFVNGYSLLEGGSSYFIFDYDNEKVFCELSVWDKIKIGFTDEYGNIIGNYDFFLIEAYDTDKGYLIQIIYGINGTNYNIGALGIFAEGDYLSIGHGTSDLSIIELNTTITGSFTLFLQNEENNNFIIPGEFNNIPNIDDVDY